jgi:hypothetical protein
MMLVILIHLNGNYMKVGLMYLVKNFQLKQLFIFSTSSSTSKETYSDFVIVKGKNRIGIDYLDALDMQHKKWIDNTKYSCSNSFN